MDKAEEIIRKISEQWFLREPAFFALYCLQRIEKNEQIHCVFRVGKSRLEYNPSLLSEMTLHEAEMQLRIEMIRIFLKHPYERQPQGIRKTSLSLASDVTIADGYKNINQQLPLSRPEDFELPHDEHYEWYARRIDELFDSVEIRETEADSTEPMNQQLLRDANEKAELWEEDDMKCSEINDLIKSLNNWGTIHGDIVALIEASTQAKIDYRLIMQGFRGSILSSHKKLTRMKPNRRTAFNQMGSMREFSSKLLVAVDVSGSVSDSTLSDFYSVINKMFKYGIEEIDCVQFDCEIGEVKNIRKASRSVEITGRGGTSYQPIFNYLLEHNYYDGIIILTDGYAPIPTIDASIHTEILWICDSEQNYEKHHRWMELIGRCCWMLL